MDCGASSSNISSSSATSTGSSFSSCSSSHDDGGVCAVISSHWDFQSFYSFPLEDWSISRQKNP